MRATLVSELKKRLLYVCPATTGGIADYGREQARAIADAGVEVLFLTRPEFRCLSAERFRLLPWLSEKPIIKHGRFLRWRQRGRTASQILTDQRGLVAAIRETGCSRVLFSAYSEYLAPFWAGSLRKLTQAGIVFGAVVHDPVRHTVVGPLWWHRWSVANGYSFVREAFVHEPVELETVRPQPQIRVSVVPHGVYAVVPPAKTRSRMREELQIPPAGRVLLSFGHVKDYKNLDLAICALAGLPDVFLVVAGSESTIRERPVSYYRDLATRLGVAARCRWQMRHIPESEIGNYFGAADLVLLTYNRAFRSASGVLNLAIGYRKPCVASAGASNLCTVVNNYGLGTWVEPDSEKALRDGILRCLKDPPEPDWQRYEQDNSWTNNARVVIDRLFQ